MKWMSLLILKLDILNRITEESIENLAEGDDSAAKASFLQKWESKFRSP